MSRKAKRNYGPTNFIHDWQLNIFNMPPFHKKIELVMTRGRTNWIYQTIQTQIEENMFCVRLKPWNNGCKSSKSEGIQKITAPVWISHSHFDDCFFLENLFRFSDISAPYCDLKQEIYNLWNHSGDTGNRTPNLCSTSQEFYHYTTAASSHPSQMFCRHFSPPIKESNWMQITSRP